MFPRGGGAVRSNRNKNDADYETEYLRLGIADGHNIIKGKQLFVPCHKLGNLFGGCLTWYNGCQFQLCPALIVSRA